ncbi:hypothetical protein ACO0QE_000838 [Hanseniaspora vineae]
MSSKNSPGKKATNSEKKDTDASMTSGTGNIEYDQLKAKVKNSLEEKAKLEAKLEEINQLIFDKETEYFGRSSGAMNQYGNIIYGFDGFSKTGASSAASLNSAATLATLSGPGTRRSDGTTAVPASAGSHARVKNSDNTDLPDESRIFSLSNAVYKLDKQEYLE